MDSVCWFSLFDLCFMAGSASTIASVPVSLITKAIVYLAAFVGPSIVFIVNKSARSSNGLQSKEEEEQEAGSRSGKPIMVQAYPVSDVEIDEHEDACEAPEREQLASIAGPLAHQQLSLQDWQPASGAQQGLAGSPRNAPADAFCVFALPLINTSPPAAAAAGVVVQFKAELQSTPFGQGAASCEEQAEARLATTEQQVEPTTPTLYVCTSSRHLGLHRNTSRLHSSCSSALSTGGHESSPLPLPSPAESPLARRVTNERDEHGFPMCPALVGLLQQQSSADSSSSWDSTDDEQQAPWAGLQLRSVPQPLPQGGADKGAANTSPPWLPLLMALRQISMDTARRSRSGGSSSSGSDSRRGHRCRGPAAAAAAQKDELSQLSVAELVALHGSVGQDQCQEKQRGYDVPAASVAVV